VLGAALTGLFLSRRVVVQGEAPATDAGSAGGRFYAAARAALIWGFVWLAPVALIAAILGRQHVFAQERFYASAGAHQLGFPPFDPFFGR